MFAWELAARNSPSADDVTDDHPLEGELVAVQFRPELVEIWMGPVGAAAISRRPSADAATQFQLKTGAVVETQL